MIEKVSFIGLGKLGNPIASVMSIKVEVAGYDIRTIENPDLNTVYDGDPAILDGFRTEIEESQVVFIAVPTPHDSDYDGSKPSHDLPPKDFSYDSLVDVIRTFRDDFQKNQLVVIISTCLPGTMRDRIVPELPDYVRLVYNPYFIAMGTVVDDFLNPEFVLLGVDDPETTDVSDLVEFYQRFHIHSSKFQIMTWDEAEATKVFYNTFISFKITFANMVQDVAVRNGNIDANTVMDVLKSGTQRIVSPTYMSPGMGDGGSCHPRDNIALKELSQRLNLGYDLFGSIMEARDIQARNMAEFIYDIASSYDTDSVCVLGSSYKPEVLMDDGSSSLLVAHYMEAMGLRVFLEHDDPDHLHERTCAWEDVPPRVYLIGLDVDWSWFTFPNDAVIVDPWKTFSTCYSGSLKDKTVINYGSRTPHNSGL